jgi:hypothetical protein
MGPVEYDSINDRIPHSISFSHHGGSMSKFILLITLLALSGSAALAQECAMSRAFMQPDEKGTRQRAVWADSNNTSLLFAEGLNVNTDGTRRSYSVADFGGHDNAINNLCNAMSDACDGPGVFEARRRLTQAAFAAGWPAEQLRRTKISPSIIPFKHGKPCDPVDGFLVSATSLHKRNITDVCDISNYVDALTVPALVLPKGESGFFTRGARVGDLAVVMLPNSTSPVFAVVGDTGPKNELGEGSVALAGKLLGKTEPPKNYDEIRGRREFVGRGWVVPRSFVLIFSRTLDEQNPFMTTERINEAAKRKFENWGGVARLQACIRQYR